MSKKKPLRLGIVFQLTNNLIYDDLLSGINRVAEEAGAILFKAPDNRANPDRELSVIESLLKEKKVDGFLIWPTVHGPLMSPALAYLLKRKIPNVLFPSNLGSFYSFFSQVRNQDMWGASQAMEHLIAQGYKKIGFLINKISHKRIFTTYRHSQYVIKLSEHGVKSYPPTFIEEVMLKPELLHRYDAVFSAQCITTERLIPFCLRQGIRIPNDLAVVGYDNTLLEQALGISSVEQHFSKIGQTACEILLHHIRTRDLTPVVKTIRPTLIVRESSASKIVL